MNQMKYAMLLIPLALALSCATPQQQPSTEFKKDIQAMEQTIETKHKDPFTIVSREAFHTLAQSIAKQYEGSDPITRYFAERTLAAAIGDSHTSLEANDQLKGTMRIFPFFLSEFASGIHMAYGRPELASLLGRKVTAIDGIPVDTVIERLSPLVSHDNEIWLRSQCISLMSNYDALHFVGIANGEETTFTFADGTVYRAKPLPLSSFDQSELRGIERTGIPQTDPGGYYRAFMIDDHSLFVQYNTCTDAPDLSVAQFTTQVFDAIADTKLETVYVDLRYNGGGDSRLFEPFIDRLAKQQKAQGFAVYVLIGHNTFSSALLNALRLKRSLDCTFVGEPTGGSVNHFGELEKAALPSQTATLYYSVKYFRNDREVQGSLKPDITVFQSLEDYRAGIDSVMAYLTD